MALPRWLEKIVDFFTRSEEGAGKIAKERLRIVIVQDRIGLTAETLEKMKGDLIQLFSKYVDIDPDNMDISFEKIDSRELAIVATIPIKTRTSRRST